MSTPTKAPTPAHRTPPRRPGFLQRHWKKLVAVVVALALLVVGGSWFYAKVWNDSPDAFDTGDLTQALAETTLATTEPAPSVTTTADPATTAAASTAATSAADAAAVDGIWNVTTASTLRYRVGESINGFDTEAVGETNQITGSLTLAGTTATAADFTVDMTTFESDESRRDSAFDGRIMSVDEFPTSSFHLTSPIEFGSVPTAGETVTATATGDLTLRGVTKSVTFELTATLDNGKVGVLGSIPVLFSDYGIPNPSFGTISTDDNGLLEFILVFERA
jgi:polyisoprenoid-binding protein YceI